VTCKPGFLVREIKPDDISIVLASDGLWDVMDEDDCARIVVATMKTISNKSGSLDPSGLKRVPQNLVDVAKSRGSADNITAMVIFL